VTPGAQHAIDAVTIAAKPPAATPGRMGGSGNRARHAVVDKL